MAQHPLLGVIMDPIASINPKKDTTLALLLKAQQRGFELRYLEQRDLFLQYGRAFGQARSLQVFDDEQAWYRLGETSLQPLDQFDVILMRKDPPVDLNYVYTTYILEYAERNGTLVVNKPQGLRDANEKLFATEFPQCMPPTLVSAQPSQLKEFILEHELVVLKTLEGMAGNSVFKCKATDPNVNVIIETLTQFGSKLCMGQKYIPAILEEGDKRILLIDGDPLPYALARIPKEGEFRGNLAAGGRGVGCKLTDQDLWICSEIGPKLREKGLLFVGIDVIGNYLTEINVTSPTCVKELEHAFGVNISDRIIDCIIEKLQD